jgi:hypothetical protein
MPGATTAKFAGARSLPSGVGGLLRSFSIVRDIVVQLIVSCCWSFCASSSESTTLGSRR